LAGPPEDEDWIEYQDGFYVPQGEYDESLDLPDDDSETTDTDTGDPEPIDPNTGEPAEPDPDDRPSEQWPVEPPEVPN
jgi:hypothetical protein